MGSQDESSLAARRARLRGSLAKQALPADPYSQDPYARAKTPDGEKGEHASVGEAKTPTPVSNGAHGNSNSNGLNGANGATGSNGSTGLNTAASAPKPSFRLEDLAATQQLQPVARKESDSPVQAISPIAAPSPVAEPNAPQPAISALSNHMPTSGSPAGLGSFGLGSLSESLKSLSRNPASVGNASSGSSALTDIADWSTAAPESADETSEPEIEAFIEASSAASNEIKKGDSDFEEQFTSLENAASGSVADFFETAGGASDPYEHDYPQDQREEEAQAEVAPYVPHTGSNSSIDDFFASPRVEPSTTSPEATVATSPASTGLFADLKTGTDDIEEPAPDQEIIPEPVAPIVNKETKSKKGGKSAKAQLQAETEDDESNATDTEATPSSANVPAPSAVLASGPSTINLSTVGQMHVIVDEVAVPSKVIIDQPAHVIIDSIAHAHVLDTLTNMDQAMGACAMNLSALQASANTQTEALRTLSEILQNQTFSELGMGLSGLMDSLSAALEPMKAVSELVPAIDQLVQIMETKIRNEPEQEEKLSPDQLVMNLADQLSTGAIDPWTFKSAYMAVFPDDHPADLLHRLVDLLGTSRLSGNLFRAAYDAVQAPDPPKRVASAGDDGNTVVRVVQDDSLMKQLDELRHNQNEFEKKMGAREEEFAELLNSKEIELSDAQELLNSRWEEFNQRYDELSESLLKRDELIQEKESEINRKDNENGRLRTQMDELKDMVSELQKQFSASKARAEALSKPGFFDSAPAAGAAPSLFDAAPAKPLFQGEPQPHQAPPQHQQQQHQAQAPAPVPQPQQQQQPAATMQAPPQPVMSAPPQEMGGGGMSAPPQMSAQATSQQAIPRQNQMTTPFAGAGPGSYGSGVRAQVFEVIVRQALAGAPWREICAGPMQVNNISPDEVESEVKRRQALLKK